MMTTRERTNDGDPYVEWKQPDSGLDEETVRKHSRKSCCSKLLEYTRNAILILTIIGILIMAIIVIVRLESPYYRWTDTKQSVVTTLNRHCLSPPLATNHFDHELQQRDRIKFENMKPILLFNGRAMVESQVSPISLLLHKGKILKVSFSSSLDESTLDREAKEVLKSCETRINLQNKFVTPGIIDCHSHLGVHRFPDLMVDVNEGSNPVFPQLRAYDALYPNDLAIKMMLKNGVTTALVLPGSANLMGGEAAYVKTVGGSVGDMLVAGAPRALKMACGENPKRAYGEKKDKMPMSRMGNAWMMREAFESTRELIRKQDEWDCQNSQVKNPNYSSRPSDLSLDALVALLRGQNTSLNIHCYELQDMEMMVRLSEEFGFRINAFHHAMEAQLAPKLLRENNITVSMFVDLYNSKKEAFEASVHAPRILVQNGVKFALKSDHPVTNAKDLMFNAGKARHYGLDDVHALESLSSVPAEVILMDHRIGYLREGYDADIVVWDRYPLLIGAHADKVIIDGQILSDVQLPLHSTRLPLKTIPELSIVKGNCNSNSDPIDISSYAIANVSKIYALDEGRTVMTNVNIIVQNGNISCIGSWSECPVDKIETVLHLKDGIIVPGLIESASMLGLYEISREDETHDGSITGTTIPTDVMARDGVIMQSKPMTAAWRSGVTTSVSHREGSSIINGQSVAFTTVGIVVDDALIKSPTALQISIGHKAKNKSGKLTGSVSGQVAQLRSIFDEAVARMNKPTSSDDVVVQVLKRQIPVVATVHCADWISQLLTLRKQYGFKLVILGAAEASVLADKLAHPDHVDSVSVVLTPIAQDHAPKQGWDKQRTDEWYGIAALLNAGVPKGNIGISSGFSPYNIRNLRFIAGAIYEYLTIESRQKPSVSLTWTDIVEMMTRNVADMFNLPPHIGRVEVNSRANFILLNRNELSGDDNILTFDNYIKVVASGTRVHCNPVQE